MGWTGGGTSTDDIYDACLQAADDPDNAPATTPVYIKGMTFDPDYKTRLVVPADRARVQAYSGNGGNYQPV